MSVSTPHETEHEQNDNWEWSDSFTEFIHEAIEGRSLKVCSGLRAICDVNLDIKNLQDVAQSENAAFEIEPCRPSDIDEEVLSLLRDGVQPSIVYGRVQATNPDEDSLYDGLACRGDMYELPFRDNAFDTVVSDPPWLNLSREERRALFDEVVRVTKPTGVILYNSTWVPDHDYTTQFELRFRQQLDFWGGPSFAAFYRRSSRNLDELFEATKYESVERYPSDSPYWSEDYPPQALSPEHNTDPKKVSSDSSYSHYCCPMCGCSRLGQLQTEFFEDQTGRYSTYQCHNCEFRVDEAEVEALAEALETAATERGIPVEEVDHIEYTPSCVEHHSERARTTDWSVAPLSTDLPWVP